MSNNTNGNSGKIWGVAAAVGVLAFLILKFIASYSFWPALLLAVLIAILVAILIWIGFYRDDEEDAEISDASDSPPAKPAQAPVVKSTEGAPESMAASMAASTASPATSLAQDGTAPSASPAEKAPAKTQKAPAKTASKPAAKKPAAKKPAKPAGRTAAATKAGETRTGGTKPARKPVAKDGKPPLLKKPRAGGADDLKLIKGVGPGLEKTLNELGFYHYDQIAAWRKKEIEWVDSRLKFKGRILRDDWVKQCKTLAKGGTTEFSKRAKKSGVYKG